MWYCRSIECTGILDEAQHDPEQKGSNMSLEEKGFGPNKGSCDLVFLATMFFFVVLEPPSLDKHTTLRG